MQSATKADPSAPSVPQADVRFGKPEPAACRPETEDSAVETRSAGRKSSPLVLVRFVCAVTLLAASLLIFLGWQIKQSLAVRTVLNNAIEQRSVIITEAQANQARTAQQLESFLSDVLALAETNGQAKAVVDRYGIRRNQPAANATGGQPADTNQ